MIIKLYLAKNGSREAYRQLHKVPLRRLDYDVFIDGVFLEGIGPWVTLVWDAVKGLYQEGIK